jgi:RES domain-containing protein
VPPQILDRSIFCYRIGDPKGEFPIYDARGSALYPGRWNTADAPVIYAGQHYSTAMLEKLTAGNGSIPPNQHYIEITIPVGVSYEIVTKDRLPGWDTPEPTASRDFGASWVRERRSAILMAPSYVARLEHNVVINPAHEHATMIQRSLAVPVWWDSRLYAKA